MIKFEELSLHRGARTLLDKVDLVIHAGQKVGVIGSNGVGKSSLFAMLLKQLHPDHGELTLPRNQVIAHVEQETPGLTEAAMDFVIDGDKALRHLQGQIQLAEEREEGAKLANLYSEYEHLGGYSAESRAATLLHGLGFSDAQLKQPVKEFSGGWRMRLNLAQALMCPSDILLLDEPTNHLDLDAVIWLEGWLKRYRGTLLLISHDRDFLDNVTTHIIHLEQQALKLYPGNYSSFEVKRAEALAAQQSSYVKQQREIKHMQAFVSRFKAKATKARQAQSRIKALEKMQVIAPAHVDSPFQFHFKKPAKSPAHLITLEDIATGYQGKPLLSGVNLSIHPGDRIGLLGHNGAGKSTLIKLLAQELDAIQGQITRAKDLKIGYFAQHQLEQLDTGASPLLHLQRIDKSATENDLRKYLGGFAFHDDMVLEPVAPLSGGEKARLVLALIVYQQPNLLLLDEPTNHLDLEMRFALTVAMQEFEGAMIIVSHDRHLLRTTTDGFYLVDQGQMKEFKGTLDDYREWVLQPKENDNPETSSGEKNLLNKKEIRKQAAEKRLQLKPLTNRLKKLEKEIEKLNDDKKEMEQLLSDNDIYQSDNKQGLSELLEKQGSIVQALEKAEAEWLEVSEELESIQN